MVLPLIGLALPLIGQAISLAAEFAPTLIKNLAGDGAGAVAEKIVSTAMDLTGAGDAGAAAVALRADPAAALQYKTALAHAEVEMAREASKQLETVNQTMRKEAEALDAYVRRWRPTFGYVVAASWFLLMLAIGWVIVTDPAEAANVILAIGSLSTMWGVALAVLGVSVHSRSKDKATAAGRPGALDALLNRLGGTANAK